MRGRLMPSRLRRIRDGLILVHRQRKCSECEDIGALGMLWRLRAPRLCEHHRFDQELHDHGMLREYLVWRFNFSGREWYR